jgi:uncharacterized protein YrrD
MSWKDMACLCIVVVGIVLFMYGSNYYDETTGWIGVYLVVAGFFAEIILKVYESLVKRKKDIA